MDSGNTQTGVSDDTPQQLEQRDFVPSSYAPSHNNSQSSIQQPTQSRTFSSNRPSANWSTSSPATSWGTTQTNTGSQAWSGSTSQTSTGQGFLEKAKEYLPGTGSTAASTGSAKDHDAAQPSLLDKAKEYLPGTGSTTAGTHGTGASTYNTGSESSYGTAQPSLLDKAKEYLPGTGSSTAGTGSSAGYNTGTSAGYGSGSSTAATGTSGGYGTAEPSLYEKAKEYLPGTSSPAAGTGSSTGFGTGGYNTGASAGYGSGSTTSATRTSGVHGTSQPSLYERAKEYLPGSDSTAAGTGASAQYGTGASAGYGTGASAGYGTGVSSGYGTGSSTAYGTNSDVAQPSLLDKAKEYLPGTGSSAAGTGSSAGYGTGSSAGYGTGTSAGYGSGSTTSATGTPAAYGTAEPSFKEKAKEYLPGTGTTTAGTGSLAGYGTGSSTAYGTNSATSHDSAQPSLLDKAKEYLPGTGSTTAGTGSSSAYDTAQPSLLDKAKEYLPGTSSTRSAGSWQGSDRSGFQQGPSGHATDNSVGANQGGTYSRPGADPVVLGSGSDYNTGTAQYTSERPWATAGNNSPSYRSNQHALATGQSGASLVGQPGSEFKPDADSIGRKSDVASERDSVVGGTSHFNQTGQRDSPVSTSTQSTFSTNRPGSNYGNESSYRPSSTFVNDGTNQSSSTYGNDTMYRPGSNYGNDSNHHQGSEHGLEGPYRPSSNHGNESANCSGSNYGNDGVNRPGSNYGNDGSERPGSEYGTNVADRPSSNHGSDSHSSQQGYGQQGYGTQSTFALPSTGIPPPFHTPAYITQDTPRYEPTLATNRQGYSESVANSGVGRGEGVHAKDALAPLTEVPAESKGIVETVMEYLPGHGHAAHEGQQGQQTTASSAYNQQATAGDAYNQQTTAGDAHNQEPSLLEKAKAYIPVLGSSTEFDPASTGRTPKEGRLYQDSLPQDSLQHEGHSPTVMDRAKAYIPTLGASSTTTPGYDAQTGGATAAPHTGLVETLKENVESLVERVQEMLPGHAAEDTTAQTGSAAGTAPYSGNAGTAQYTSTEREVDPFVQGVKLTSVSTFGSGAGSSTAGYSNTETAHAPGMLDRVKQLVGLGPSNDADQTGYGLQYSSSNSPNIANQGINAGFLGSQRLDSHPLDDEDEFQDAVETPAESFTAGDTAYGSAPSSNTYGGASTGNTYGAASTNSSRQPYVNQSGPPLVENDPEETFGPVKQQTRTQPAPEPAQSKRDTVSFGDESDEEYETDANGKRGARSKLKGKLGARREQHHEKKREKADHQLEQKMQEKELSKTNAVTTPAAAEQATPATAGSNLGPGGGGGMMGGVAGGTPADPQGNAQSEDKAAAEKAPENAKAKDPKDPHAAVKANEKAGGTNIAMGSAAQRRMDEAPAKKSKGFMSKLKKPFSKNKS